MGGRPSTSGSQPVYRSGLLQPDGSKARAKHATPVACPDCSAVYHAGRWQWLAPPASPRGIRCPACRRIREDRPAGYVRLEGDFLVEHCVELLALVRSVEKKERAERPLKRIMRIAEDGRSLLVTTTDARLARDIGEALRHAYQGSLQVQYARDENRARVLWKR